MYALMLDSNAFDNIYDNKITEKVRKAIDEGTTMKVPMCSLALRRFCYLIRNPHNYYLRL
jgi:hypothetical protein